MCGNLSHFSHSDINEWSLFKRSHCRGSKRYFENVNSGLEPGAAGMHHDFRQLEKTLQKPVVAP